MAIRSPSADAAVVANLRHRWPEELKNFSDQQIADVYHDFSVSDDYGDNDAKFPLWFDFFKAEADGFERSNN